MPKSLIIVTLVSTAVALMASCDSAGPSDGGSIPNGVATVRIEADSDTLAGPGDTVQLRATVLDADGTEITSETVAWTSLDESVATINASATLRAEDFGTVLVRAEVDGKLAQRLFHVANVLPATASGPVIAIANVNLVPMTSDVVLARQTIVIRDGRISEVGTSTSVAIPADATLIEAGEDQPWYLMPGLADMHVHMTGSSADQDDHMLLYVANGVTTVREMWGNGNSLRQKGRRELGVLGPRIFAASPGLDGPGGPWTGSTPPVTDVDQARARVRQHRDEGYDFIKVYNLLEVPVYEAIMDEAALAGIRVIGHVPQKVDLQQALDLKQYSMEHLLGFGAHVSSTGTLNTGTLSDARVVEWAGKVAASETWNSPTLTVDMLSTGSVQTIKRSNPYRYVPNSMRNFFETGFFQGFSESLSQSIERNHKRMLRALRDAGAPILLGTDAGFGYLIPGFAIHDELMHLVDAGLTPYEALAAGTERAAAFLDSAAEFGTIETGKSADLILVYGNPLDDVARTKRRLGVMVEGSWLSEPHLRTLLEAIATKNGR